MSSRRKIAFAQTVPRLGEMKSNLARASELVAEAAPFDVLVLPELFSTGYFLKDRADARGCAESLDGPTVTMLRECAAAHGGWVCGGFAESDGEALFNSAALAGPDGDLHVYRKVHLFDREKLLFDPGDRPFRAIELATRAGPLVIGILVCFDWYFPEAMRCLVLDGAEVILHPSNLVLPYAQEAMKTRRLENRVFAVTANRSGEDARGEERIAFTGWSQIVDPRSRVLFRAADEGEAVHCEEIDLALARRKEITDRNEVLADRRPEMYGGLTA